MKRSYDDYYNEPRRKKVKQKTVGGAFLKVFLLFLLSVFCILVSVVAGVGIGFVVSTPQITVEDVKPSEYPSRILDKDGNVMIELTTAGSNRQEATASEIPQMLKNAVVAIEDERFYEHNGVDIRGIARAVYVDITEGKDEGASTITQQLIKNNVIETGGYERSAGSLIRRKVQEWVMALDLEKIMTKDDILTNYLNTIYLGSNCNGVKAAASYYFGKDLSELTLSECSAIVAITKNPSAYNPSLHPEANQQRRELVLENMVKLGYITQQECDEAKADDIYSRMVANSSEQTSIYSYFEDALISDVLQDLQTVGYTYNQAYNMLFSGGLTIYSTQDTQMQSIIEEEINNQDNYPMETTYSISWDLSVQHSDGSMSYYYQSHITRYHRVDLGDTDYRLNFYSKEEADAAIEEFKATILEDGDRITYEDVTYTLQPQVSFTLMDYSTGRVLAAVGGRGDKQQNLSLNRATDTLRQPGSTFKILAAFAPAMNSYGYTLASVQDDSPFEYDPSEDGTEGKSIENWWGDEYRGLSNIRDGIRDSMNIIAAKTLYSIGGNATVEYLKAFGFKNIDEIEDANVATALGGITNGVTNLELCAAYSAIANQGTYIEPTMYTQVVARDGTIVLDANQETNQVVRPTVAALLTDAMEDVVTEGTGTKCALDNTPLAGKTGTTSNDYDLWFAGFIPRGLCGTIWAGYDENISIDEDEFHKDLYSTIMNRVVSECGYSGGEFTMPDGIVQVQICRKSGLLPIEGLCMYNPNGTGVYTEYFEEGTEPTDYCETHTTAYVCSETGLLANEYCPGYYQVCIIRPDDIRGGSAKGYTLDSPYAYPYAYCEVHNAATAEEETSSEGETSEEETSTDSQNGGNPPEPPAGEIQY